MTSDTEKRCKNCQYFKFGMLRKTFEGQELYYRGTCQHADNFRAQTISSAGELCGLFRLSEDVALRSLYESEKNTPI
jgi:hypothetical protein